MRGSFIEAVVTNAEQQKGRARIPRAFCHPRTTIILVVALGVGNVLCLAVLQSHDKPGILARIWKSCLCSLHGPEESNPRPKLGATIVMTSPEM